MGEFFIPGDKKTTRQKNGKKQQANRQKFLTATLMALYYPVGLGGTDVNLGTLGVRSGVVCIRPAGESAPSISIAANRRRGREANEQRGSPDRHLRRER